MGERGGRASIRVGGGRASEGEEERVGGGGRKSEWGGGRASGGKSE